MTDINTFVQEFCDTGARAVSRYAEVSDDDYMKMPEYFMPAFIFDNLRTPRAATTITLETSFTDLIARNASVRKRRGFAEQGHNDQLLRLAEQLGGRRIDMALFEGEAEQKPRNEQDFVALVEFKKGWIDSGTLSGKISDRDRLLLLLACVDTCPWGIVCGWIPQYHYDWQKNETLRTADRLFTSKIKIRDVAGPLLFCARLFARDSDEGRVKELLQSFS